MDHRKQKEIDILGISIVDNIILETFLCQFERVFAAESELIKEGEIILFNGFRNELLILSLLLDCLLFMFDKT